jgi:hypothetical protein
MGAWGPGVFSNDTSADIRGDFRELLEDGLTPESATVKLVQGAGTAVDDQDDATSFWTGLAAAQMTLGVLQPAVRDRAIGLIDSGGDLALWDDPRGAAKRKAVLERLRSQLLGPQKAPVKVRRPRRIPSPVKAGDVFLLTLDDGRRARFRVLGMNEHRMGDFPIVELIDDRGRPFRNYYRNPDAMSKQDPWARYLVVSSRLKDLPTDAKITVIGTMKAEPRAQARTYTNWRNLPANVQRLLDEPEAQPT